LRCRLKQKLKETTNVYYELRKDDKIEVK